MVADWRVDVHYKIPLPKPPDPAPGGKVSTKLNLCSARQRFPAVLEKRLVACAGVQVARFDLAQMGDDLGHRLALATGEVLDAGDEFGIGESCERGEVGVHDVFIPRRFSGL